MDFTVILQERKSNDIVWRWFQELISTLAEIITKTFNS